MSAEKIGGFLSTESIFFCQPELHKTSGFLSTETIFFCQPELHITSDFLSTETIFFCQPELHVTMCHDSRVFVNLHLAMLCQPKPQRLCCRRSFGWQSIAKSRLTNMYVQLNICSLHIQLTKALQKPILLGWQRVGTTATRGPRHNCPAGMRNKLMESKSKYVT